MPRYECSGCGALVGLTDHEGHTRREECPVCEETTVWTVAFEDEGVSR
jgi:hypothetical protein